MTEPRTAAGLRLYTDPAMHGEDCPMAFPEDQSQTGKPCECWLIEILAIEAEAAAAVLDVERLATAIENIEGGSTYVQVGSVARDVAAEYDRLASAEESSA